MKQHKYMAALATAALLTGGTGAAGAEDEKLRYLSINTVAATPSKGIVSGTLAGRSWRPRAKLAGGTGLTVAIGHEGKRRLRTEIEIGQRSTEYDSLKASSVWDNDETIKVEGTTLNGDMRTTTLMVNAIWMIGTKTLRPYIGTGVGIGWQDVSIGRAIVKAGDETHEVYGINGDGLVGAAQAMAGVSVQITKGAEARVGYRMVSTTHAKIEDHKFGYATHGFEAGVAIRF